MPEGPLRRAPTTPVDPPGPWSRALVGDAPSTGDDSIVGLAIDGDADAQSILFASTRRLVV